MSENQISSNFFLRDVLKGHSQDVRVVAGACFSEGAIVTGSRDLTTRVWTLKEDQNIYQEAQCLEGPSGFVSALCAMPPSDQFSQGLILVGSHDCNIYCFSLSSPSPLYKLLGHSGPVCSLASGQFGAFVSGSWDKSARVWSGQKSVMTLDGHQGAVWAVAIMSQQGLILTGSADKSIRLWRAGKCEKTFIGHEDCVRGLAMLTDEEFLSCSNDGTIRHWISSGACIMVYKGHSSFVYSIATIENSDFFVSCGEDRTVRIWQNRGSCRQVIQMPCQTVWSVDILANGDIVAGCNDCLARVFTRDECQRATSEQLKAFQEQVANSALSQEVLTDFQKEDLPGEEILTQSGNREGHTVLVKNDGKVSAFMWSMAQQSWQKIGDVLEGPVRKDSLNGRVMFEGKEYDYVFNVDIEDGKKPLKLPFNRSEDPWTVAQQFIFKHNLPQDYLEKIAQFIFNNAKVAQEPIPPDFCDPFTGQNRYVPGSSRTSSIDASYTEHSALGEKKHIPYCGKWIAFDIANTSGMLQKLREFNSQVPPENNIRDDDELTLLKDLVECRVDHLPGRHEELLKNLLKWPEEFMFPVLDVLRCAIRSATFVDSFDNDFFEGIVHYIASPIPANRMLSLRFFVNIFASEAGQRVARRLCRRIIQASSEFGYKGNKNTQIALGSLFLNYVILFNEGTSETELESLSGIVESTSLVIEKLTDMEARFRLTLALGTLLSHQKELCAAASQHNLVAKLTIIATQDDQSAKLKQCALQCVNLITENRD